MRRRGLTVILATFLAGAGVAAGLALAPEASGQSTPVTPKMQAPPEARSMSRAFAAVAKALRPAVVRIDVEVENPRAQRQPGRAEQDRRNVPPELRDFFERFFNSEGEAQPFANPDPGRGTGSGMVFDSSGHVLTNSHVVKNATKVTVTFADGRIFPARVVGMDELTDVAVVKLEKPPSGLVVVRMGDSERMEIGEWVMAVGSPLGMDQSVTAGIISSKGKVGRNVPGFGGQNNKVREYLQTDAKINPGNSGGPLVNLDGEVIGINTMINVGPGGAYGFAIPMNQARRVAESLVKDGRVRYAYLGVTVGDIQDLKPQEREQLPKASPEKAAVVTNVMPGSPASKGGLRSGDLIVRLDSEKIEGKGDLVGYVSSRSIGARVAVAFVREGKPQTLTVTLAELPASAGEPRAENAAGLSLQDLTPDVARFLGLDPGTSGAVISDVTPQSRAARAGLRAEDILLEVNRAPVTSAEDALTKLRGGPQGEIMVRVRRGKQPPRIVVIPAK